MTEKKEDVSEKDVETIEDEKKNQIKIAEIGRKLQELRIKKNLSIEDVQEITKIRSRYIQAIEEGNIEKLPGRFYAKAFMKSYAEVLELDPSILDEYNGSIPVPEIENVQIKPQYTPGVSNSKLGKWLIVSLVYILIGLVLLFAYMFYVSYSSKDNNLPGDQIGGLEVPIASDNQKGGQGASNNNQNNQDTSTAKKQPEDLIDVNKVSTSTFSNRPLEVYEVVVKDNVDVQVQLKYTDRCWVDIREGGNNGKQLVSGTFTTGQETDKFLLNNEMWLHLGNALGADIYINNKKIKAGNENGPKYISIVKK